MEVEERRTMSGNVPSPVVRMEAACGLGGDGVWWEENLHVVGELALWNLGEGQYMVGGCALQRRKEVCGGWIFLLIMFEVEDGVFWEQVKYGLYFDLVASHILRDLEVDKIWLILWFGCGLGGLEVWRRLTEILSSLQSRLKS